MSISRQAKQILEQENPSITWLRSQPKESIIQAILEMKRIYSDVSMEIRKMDNEIALTQLEIQKLELQHKLEVTSKMIEYGVEIKDHRYGPKAIGDVSMSIAAMWHGDELPKTGSLKTIEDSDLAKRANLAEEQGIVWNLQNKRPERDSTIRRKVEAWEDGIKRGMEADPSIFCTKTPDEIKAMGPDHKAFMTGLCMQMEAALGKEPQHRYLVPRFKNIARKYKDTLQAVPAPAPIAPPIPTLSPEDRAKELLDKIYTAWLGQDYRSKIKEKDKKGGNKVPILPGFKRTLERHIRLIVDMDPEDSIRDRNFAVEVLWDLIHPSMMDMVSGNLDWAALCGRETWDYSDIYRAYKLTPDRKQLIDDAFEGWWTEMCEKEGL